MDLVSKYFSTLTAKQKEQLILLEEVFGEWNNQVNLVSRKDMENLQERHILHSLAIAKVINFTPGTEILDVGTGGGFPGIPLSIYFPEVSFTLVDSIGKKIKAVQDMITRLGLVNARAINRRAEEIPQQFDFITGRAVADISTFSGWVKGKVKSRGRNGLPNGILYLKGGDLEEELSPFGKRAQIYPISSFFEEEFFETKSVVYLEMTEA
ncbi:MAG: 16S rRNA (guanine(527)-N(7))-methyltransferase RsmG [Bacteroidota bacterium]|nr:16S rRNA (guanine(527)-N(7))-methyltransferase RsmG [Bacteroidota bacterium]